MNNNCVLKRFPDITETLKSHDQEMEKRSKAGKPGLVEIPL